MCSCVQEPRGPAGVASYGPLQRGGVGNMHLQPVRGFGRNTVSSAMGRGGISIPFQGWPGPGAEPILEIFIFVEILF